MFKNIKNEEETESVKTKLNVYSNLEQMSNSDSPK